MFMSEIDKKIQHARPSLKSVSPLTYLMVMGYGIGNAFLAPAFLEVKPHTLVVVNSVFNGVFWAVLFEILGLLLLWGVHKNNWKLLRRTLALGLCAKTVIMYALIINFFQHPAANYSIIVLWAMISYFQAATLIHPIPVLGEGSTQMKGERKK